MNEFRYIAIMQTVAGPLPLDYGDAVSRCRTVLRGWQWNSASDAVTIGEFARPKRHYPHALPRCTVLGRILERPDAAASVALSMHSSAADVARAATEAYWGRYTAFITNDDASVSVLRDPGGRQSCYFITLRPGLHVVFSDLEDAIACGFVQLSINWNHVFAALNVGIVQSRETGLENVSEIFPGELFKFAQRAHMQCRAWDPASIASHPFKDHATAVTAVRETIQGCVDQLLIENPTTALSLSGGLDSSSIAAVLHKSPEPKRVVCVNRFSDFEQGDERPYARMVAEKFAFELIEGPLAMATLDFQQLLASGPLTTRPDGEILVNHRIPFWNDISQKLGTTTLWTGYGGDQAFFASRWMYPAQDYLRTRGLRPGLFKCIADVATLSRSSYVSVIASMSKGQQSRKIWDLWRLSNRFLGDIPETKVDGSTLVPWADDFEKLPPGKAMHAAMLGMSLRPRASDHFEMFEAFDPMLFQPVVEALLRVPSYFMSKGGTIRSFERAVFGPELPSAIVNRYTKGRSSQDYRASILSDKNNKYLKMLLLEGKLASAGLLNRITLENFFKRGEHMATGDIGSLNYLMVIEAWVARMENAKRMPQSEHFPSAMRVA
ncbi:asparagine synthase-related protein [Roseiterribacter gracilis]|uniref:asparagine synthase (glutamine-hydrolyzing) n=1 Tax=Roseiterribacter gracilis TaxID=2812848 RepID=A0A8S8X8W4_9PROT|nr:asparagine synthase [Rhodospirillales bacterium TMPK1]